MAIRCPNCQASNDDDARFCASCGTPLTRRCPACGAEVPPRARYCPSCGAPVDTEAAIAAPPSRNGDS